MQKFEHNSELVFNKVKSLAKVLQDAFVALVSLLCCYMPCNLHVIQGIFALREAMVRKKLSSLSA